MLSGDINIVPMAAKHIEAIAALERLCFSMPWSAASLAEELSNSQAHFLAAVCKDEVAGYIGVQEICGEGYITNVAVYPEYRKQGIASELITAALNGAKSRGCEFLTLEVRVSNESAISLYKRHGFKHEGLRKSFYSAPTEDALMMTLRFGDKKLTAENGD